MHLSRFDRWEPRENLFLGFTVLFHMEWQYFGPEVVLSFLTLAAGPLLRPCDLIPLPLDLDLLRNLIRPGEESLAWADSKSHERPLNLPEGMQQRQLLEIRQVPLQ